VALLRVGDAFEPSRLRATQFLKGANMKRDHNNAPTEFVQVNGVSYAYRRFGATPGTPIVFLQHFRGGLDNWDPLVTDGLALDRPVILFNNAGVASATGQPADTIREQAAHVVKFITALKIGLVDLFGFSTGGFVAQQVAIDHPDLVRRVILAGTGPQGGEGMSIYAPKVAEYATREIPVREDFLYLFFSPSESSQSAGKAFWERRHERTEQDAPTSMAAMKAQANAISAWGAVPASDRYASLKTIRQPVLVVNGNNDVMVPTVNSYILEQNIPNATLIIYPDSGHGAIFQHAGLFVSHAKTFLDSPENVEGRAS
jgi:pimeloyl-ACP methyl ester carboxylesterase